MIAEAFAAKGARSYIDSTSARVRPSVVEFASTYVFNFFILNYSYSVEIKITMISNYLNNKTTTCSVLEIQ